ncbi:hypothetical protein [Nonomuraea sp. NPDC049400]
MAGVPDELRGEVLVAYVVPKPGAVASGDLAGELQRFLLREGGRA